MDAKTDTVAPPSTQYGIVVKRDENFGITPAINRISAAPPSTQRLITFVVATIPTFWLYVAVGSPPRRENRILEIPYPTIPPCSSWSVGIRFIPPLVVAEKSPIAWMELIANRRPIATQAEGSKRIPKWSGLGTWKRAASWIGEKSTIPKNSAMIYPPMIPIRMDASFQIPFPKWFNTVTIVNVKIATSQFCQEP